MVIECVFVDTEGVHCWEKGSRGKWAEWNLGRNGEEIQQEQSIYEMDRNHISYTN